MTNSNITYANQLHLAFRYNKVLGFLKIVNFIMYEHLKKNLTLAFPRETKNQLTVVDNESDTKM